MLIYCSSIQWPKRSTRGYTSNVSLVRSSWRYTCKPSLPMPILAKKTWISSSLLRMSMLQAIQSASKDIKTLLYQLVPWSLLPLFYHHLYLRALFMDLLTQNIQDFFYPIPSQYHLILDLLTTAPICHWHFLPFNQLILDLFGVCHQEEVYKIWWSAKNPEI